MSKEVIKVLITGSFSSGKTSFIRAVSEFDCVSTELEYFKNNLPEKFYPDFGRITLEEDQRYLLFLANSNNGIIPDPSTWTARYTNLWKYHKVYVIIIDHRTVDSEGHDHTPEMKAIIKIIQARNTPYILLANKRKDIASYSLTEMRMRLGLTPEIPFIEADIISNPASAKLALTELFNLLPQDDLVQAAIKKLSEDVI